MANGLNNTSVLDSRKLLTGKDGQLHVSFGDGASQFLAECNTFQAQMNVTNTDYQPVGSALSFAVNTGYSVTLTLTESVVRDDVLLSPLLDELKKGKFPTFTFTGKLHGRGDDTVETITYYNCVPDGTIDLQNLTPGEVINRAWSFRVNQRPNLDNKLTSTTN